MNRWWLHLLLIFFCTTEIFHHPKTNSICFNDVFSMCPTANRQLILPNLTESDLTQRSIPINLPIKRQKYQKANINIWPNFCNLPNVQADSYFSVYFKQFHLLVWKSRTNSHWEDFFLHVYKQAHPAVKKSICERVFMKWTIRNMLAPIKQKVGWFI